MILLVDNYDSFTYNLAQHLGQLRQTLEVRRNDRISLDEIESLAPERIVISPGPGTPRDAGISIPLIQRFAGKIPILGVCLGHQAIGAAFGGRVVPAPELMHGKTSEVVHDGKTIFRGLPPRFPATRYHSLIVERKSLPRILEISAETAEPSERGAPRATRGIIMGLRLRRSAAQRLGGAPLEGVQFHPESILTHTGMQILRNFLSL
jgi:anthranilate synthase/aminodeoxychorismate synthase-like glutamine amidotransferase